MKILVADDDLDQLTLRCQLLERSGFQAVQASDLEAALAVAKTEKPACAVIDLFFPNEESGLRLVRDLKALDSAIHVVLLTGATSARLANRSEARLIDEIVEKGSSSAKLVQRLKALERAGSVGPPRR
jgi:DNA-binding response OmpR family regulator